MKEFRDKDEALHNARQGIEMEFLGLHPTDKVEAFRELGRHASARADLQEGLNDHDGVPEHPRDQKESAISERMDGSK